jgi:hypothetical protein
MPVDGGLIVGAGRADVADLAVLAAAATWDGPVAQALVPDPRLRPGVLHAWYAILIGHALDHGRVDMSADRRSAAVWLDRTAPLPAPADYLRRLTIGCGPHTAGILRHEQFLERHAPRAGHLQLGVLAARSGPAAVLLAHRHQCLDRAGIAAYAVAGSVDELTVLTGAGYRAGVVIGLPGGPPLWPLWRRPTSGRATAGRLVPGTAGEPGHVPPSC